MNILFLCDEYPPCKHGGIGTVTQVLARELSLEGHKVVVCGFYPYYRKAEAYEEDNDIKVYRFFYGNRFSLKLSKQRIAGRLVNVSGMFNRYLDTIQKLIKEFEIDIMEIPDYNEVFRYSGPRHVFYPDFNIPKVVKIHGGDTFFGYLMNGKTDKDSVFYKEKRLIEDACSLIAISEFSCSVVKKIFGYKKDIPVIYNGINVGDPLPYRENPGTKTIIFAGTITEKKGIFNLIRAWDEVVCRFPDARLFIYGKGSERTLNQLYSLLTERTRKSVYLKGFIDRHNLEKVYSSATCAVFPSFAESFGMAPLEAMATGCPTIFTTRTSGPELIKHGVEGLLTDPGNIDELSGSIIRLIANRDEAVKLGQAGAEKVRSHFDISIIARQHISLYEELLKSPKKSS